MGMDFIGARRSISMHLSGWCEIYQLGIDGGWSPRGAVFDNWPYENTNLSQERSDDYFTNAGQLVDEIDSEALANALEKMLPSVADTKYDEFIGDGSIQPNVYKDRIRRFVEMCREGGFRIL